MIYSKNSIPQNLSSVSAIGVRATAPTELVAKAISNQKKLGLQLGKKLINGQGLSFISMISLS